MNKKFFAILVSVFAICGMMAITGTVEANGIPHTLNVTEWSGPNSTGVSGRETVLKVGDTYHMWYSPSDSAIYYTSSTTPTGFVTSTACNFTETAPAEMGSVTVLEEDGTFYMIAYGASDDVFNIYTSTDGTAWANKGLVFDGANLPAYNKIDGPYLFKDGAKYRLYFQVKTPATSPNRYDIYTAESSAASLAAIAASGETVDFVLVNSNSPVLSPSTNASDWDGTMVMHPWVVKDGDTYYMWYSAHNGSGPQQIGFAYSSDGYNWTKSRGNPIISRVTYNAVGEPSVIKDGDTWRMWYLPASGGIRYLEATGPFEFSSIQSAVNAASNGDTINVTAGTYHENVTLPADKDLTLLGAQHDVNPGCEGERGGESILDGEGYASDKYGIEFPTDAGTIVINGFTIKNYGYGIWGRTAGTHVTGATISYNILENNGDPALPGGGATDGLWHDDGGALRIKNMDDSTITYNLVRNSERGIRLENDSAQTSDDNVISYNCIHDNQQYGIAIYDGGNNNTVEYNTVYNNPDRGIQLTWGIASDGNKINYNTVYNNCNDGVLLVNASNAEIKGNIVHNNAFTDQTLSGESTTNGGPNSGFGWQPVHGGITVNYDSVTGDNITISGNDIYDNGVLPEGQWSAWAGKRSNTEADGIYIGASTTGATVNFNNIEDNQQYGVENLNTINTLDATNNWWGDASGPSGVGDGTGDAVSANVNYDPWLDAPAPDGKPISFTGIKEKLVTNGTLDAITEASTTVAITGTATTTVAKYSDNPGDGFTGDIGKYIDVHLDSGSIATELEIRLHYEDSEISGLDESSLKMKWWDGDSWEECSLSGVDTGANYIWAKITATSSPSLTDLSGTPFGAGGSPIVTTEVSRAPIPGQFAPITGTTVTTGEVLGATTKKAMTVDELMAKVIELRAQLEELQRRLLQSTGKVLGAATSNIIPQDFTFKNNLKEGDSLIDVKYLQIILNSDPETRLALSGAGSPGNETTYFGPLTQAAVIKFQNIHADEVLAPWGLTKGTGFVGSTTRAKLNQILGH
jgi:parallel beta-helix repeat protein